MMTDRIEGAALSALSRALFRAGAAHPFLREPIERMARIPDASVQPLGTDGIHIFYRPDEPPEEAAVGHLLMHCLFRHPLAPEGAVRPLWDLACDISAEFLRTEFFPAGDGQLTRLQILDALPEGVDPRVAGAVYRSLADLFEDELEPLTDRVRRDDHRCWYVPHAPVPRAMADANGAGGEDFGQAQRQPETAPFFDTGSKRSYREWLELALEDLWPPENGSPTGASRTGRYGLAPGSREERMLLREEGKHDFSRYLRRFSTTREEMKLDLAGFDYIPYCYGLERYGNLPLVEPLETRESRRVEQLVIAVDTSASCSRPTVERFFGEIERILMKSDCFFDRMEVHILQCDAMIQSHVEIHSREEWQAYTGNIVVRGRGGTSFIPVFERVASLQSAGRLARLKGLLYFTDGDGAYPRKAPPYETAFVFTTRKALEYRLPPWIIPLCLQRPTE